MKQLNYQPIPFDPGSIDFVLRTHAHIDHAGLLPKLWKDGFKGHVFMTRGARDLLSFMLPDNGHIQGMDVENLNVRYARRQRAGEQQDQDRRVRQAIGDLEPQQPLTMVECVIGAVALEPPCRLVLTETASRGPQFGERRLELAIPRRAVATALSAADGVT